MNGKFEDALFATISEAASHAKVLAITNHRSYFIMCPYQATEPWYIINDRDLAIDHIQRGDYVYEIGAELKFGTVIQHYRGGMVERSVG
jgi:hypothetical protein